MPVSLFIAMLEIYVRVVLHMKSPSQRTTSLSKEREVLKEEEEAQLQSVNIFNEFNELEKRQQQQ